MLLIFGVILALALGAQAQLNPLGRFGKCIDVPTVSYKKEGVVWYLQYHPDNPDHYVHTCQAQYEKTVKGDLVSLLYFYNKGKMVNNPQNIKYRPVSPGKYYRKITTDDETVLLYLHVLYYDPKLEYRLLYICADNEHANPDIFNVAISTLKQVPSNLHSVLTKGKAKLKAISPKFDVPLMKVEQSLANCEPLKVSSG